MNINVTFRKLEDNDLLLFKVWLYTPHVAQWYHDPLDWIDEVEKRNDEYNWLHHFIVEGDGEPIGFCQYYEYCDGWETWHGQAETDGTYSIDYMIGDASYLKKGIGKQIIKYLIKEIKLKKNAKRIIVQPDPENKASCQTLLSCGLEYDDGNEIYIMNL